MNLLVFYWAREAFPHLDGFFLLAIPNSFKDFIEDLQCWKAHHSEHIILSGTILEQIDCLRFFIVQNYMMKYKSIISKQRQSVHILLVGYE